MNNIRFILTISSLFIIAACGGGGDSQPPAAAKTVKLTVVLQGSAVASVKGIHAKIEIPSNVTLRADATGEVSSGVITQAANTPAGFISGKYTAATNGFPATVTIDYATSGNFTEGNVDVLIVNSDLLSGTTAPTAAAFTLNGVRFVDADGIDVIGPSLTLR